MSAFTAAGTRPQAQQAQSESSGCILQLIAIGMIVFGSLFIYNKGVEILYNYIYDPNVAIEAEMRYWQKKDPCLPGEVLHFTWLGDKGAHRVECVPGNNMPQRGEPRG